MKKLLVIINLLFISFISISQVSTSFEFRYFTKDRAAAGQTDFKGEYEYFNTEQRIDFLRAYADIASIWFHDSALNKKVNEKEEVERFLSKIKPKPLPEKRSRIILNEWKKAGIGYQNTYKNIYDLQWDTIKGVAIKNGHLYTRNQGVILKATIDTLQWRFLLKWNVMRFNGSNPFILSLKRDNRIIAETGFHSNGNVFFTDRDQDRMGMAFENGKWYNFRLEGDLVNNKYNLTVNENLIGEWVNMNPASLINNFEIRAGESIVIDEIKGIEFDTTGCQKSQPYHFIPFINENFNGTITSTEWYTHHYDDKIWETDELPIVHGGVLESGEDLYLRKKIIPGSFKKAFLNIETLDPGGEIWINGEVVFVTREKHPIKLDISEFLNPHQENIIAIRVFSYYNDGPLYHSSLDRNVGWFCGRAWIDLTEDIYIDDFKTHTSAINSEAIQFHKFAIENNTDTTFSGKVEINYFPWLPVESSSKIATFEIPFTIFAGDSVQLSHKGLIKNPLLWTHEHPNLYRLEIKILHENRMIDDETVVTGIRTISQENGIFRINGDPELLGGAQTMGFRMPIENNAKWNRCPPDAILADELLACKKLGNTLRIHVHSGGTYAYSVNDPRVAEMADQMGIMLIWPTTSWIRQGEWGGIDFTGYPKYMDQVYNHPSIVIWEGANHPNRFDGKPLSYTNRFIKKIYQTIAENDSSRLISPASYNRHFAYRNDEGTIDINGNKIVPSEEWTAPLIVRGNQDALTGYGATWDNIRNFPDAYRKSFIDSRERAYFNFEHEESIGMDNFSLAKGKPWYQMPSYENIYDIGSIGRELNYDEWRASQAWQAFSAWESMKWQRIIDVDGFSWCCLHGGPNSGTYRKPLIDALGHAKLSYYVNQMALQDVVAGSDNTDVVYYKKDQLTPVILNVGGEKTVKLKVVVESINGEVVDTREFNNLALAAGRSTKKIPPFRPKFPEEGYYVIKYYILTSD